MHCQQGTSSSGYSVDDVEGFLFSGSNTNFAKNGNLNILDKGLDDFLN